MAGYDPRKAAQKQIRRGQEATTDYVDGVRSTTKNPMAEAVKKLPKMKQNFIRAMDSGKVKEGLESVTEAEWKEKTASVGGARYASGIEAAAPKIASFHDDFAAFMATHGAKIDNMEDTTPEQRIQKMVANATGIRDGFKRTRRRR